MLVNLLSLITQRNILVHCRIAEPRASLENQGWGCGLYTIEVGARGLIFQPVKDRIRSLFWAWVPADSRIGFAQLIKHASWISLLCSFSLFHDRDDPHWFMLRLVEPRDGGQQIGNKTGDINEGGSVDCRGNQ